jgi:hypothetical protein
MSLTRTSTRAFKDIFLVDGRILWLILTVEATVNDDFALWYVRRMAKRMRRHPRCLFRHVLHIPESLPPNQLRADWFYWRSNGRRFKIKARKGTLE